METISDVEEGILVQLLRGAMSKYEIAEASGRAYSAIHKAVASLLDRGLISVERVAASSKNRKIDVEYYKLTDTGLEIAEALAAKREALADSMLPKASSLVDWYTNRFTRFLYHLDLAIPKITPARIYATLNLYPAVVFIRALVSPSKEDRVYNRFLASVYVESVDERLRQLDEERIRQGLRPSLIEAMWRVCSPQAWRKRGGEEPLPGYIFNFLKAYHANLTEDIVSVLKKAGPNISNEELPGLVFARLKICSHPVQERRKLIKEIWQKTINGA
ncbi:MAG: helix-turn-helix domain-containing protein [Candidatus Bathyarchaeia archaeon]